MPARQGGQFVQSDHIVRPAAERQRAIAAVPERRGYIAELLTWER